MPRLFYALLIATVCSAVLWTAIVAGVRYVARRESPDLRGFAAAHLRDAAHTARHIEREIRMIPPRLA